VAIAVSVAQIGWMMVRKRKVEPAMWASFAIILVFGGATLLFHNDDFIKWKPPFFTGCSPLLCWGQGSLSDAI